MSHTYYIRTTQDDWNTLIDVLQSLGVISPDGETADTLAWIPFGQVLRDTGETIIDPETGTETPEMAPVLDPDGHPYQHANLITRYSLVDAMVVQSADPEVLAVLEDWDRFFMTEPPESPYMVMMG